MALTIDQTQVILNNGVPVVFPKDAASVSAPMLSGVDATGAVQVVRVTPTGALEVNASVSVTQGETEITNDVGNPIPSQMVTALGVPVTDFPDAAVATKLDAANLKLDAIATNTANINVNVGDVDVNTDELEAKVDATNLKLDALLAKKSVVGSSDAFYADSTMVPLTNAWQNVAFGFNSFNITLTHDGAITDGDIFYSFDGVTTHGRLRSGEGFAHDFQTQPSIWMKGAAGGEAYRLGAY